MIAVFQVWGSGALASAPSDTLVVSVTGMSAQSLVADTTIPAALGDSLFRVLMARDFFITGEEPRRGIIGGYRRLPNPLHMGLPPSDTAAAYQLELILEQSDYGAYPNIEESIMHFWLFGPLAFARRRNDVRVAGVVQWRALLHGRDGTSLTAVGVGVAAGWMRDLDRRSALLAANRRALWNLACDIAEVTSAASGVKLKKPFIKGLEADEYRAAVDGW